MGARTRGIANNILSDGLDATDGLSGALSSSNITNASVTNVTSTPSIGGGFDKVASDPPSPTEGDIWYNTTSNTVKGYVLSPRSAAWATGGTLSTNKDKPGFAGTQTAALSFGGQTTGPNYSTDTESYDGSSWTSLNSLPAARGEGASAGTQTAAFFAGGRTTGDSQVNTSYDWDGTNWTSSPGNMNTTRYIMGSCGTQTAGLATGGYTTGNISSAEEYNGSTWTSVTSMPISRRTQIGFGIQTNAVIAGGQAPPNAAASEVLGYDGTTWTSLNNLNAARSDAGSSGDASSAIIFNGFSGGGSSNTAAYYDGTSFSSAPNTNTTKTRVGGLSSGSTQGAALQVAGGPSYTNTSEEFLGDDIVTQVKTLG